MEDGGGNMLLIYEAPRTWYASNVNVMWCAGAGGVVTSQLRASHSQSLTLYPGARAHGTLYLPVVVEFLL